MGCSALCGLGRTQCISAAEFSAHITGESRLAPKGQKMPKQAEMVNKIKEVVKKGGQANFFSSLKKGQANFPMKLKKGQQNIFPYVDTIN